MNIDSSNDPLIVPLIIPFGVEAAWLTSRWDSLERLTARFQGTMPQDFNTSVGVILSLLHKRSSWSDFQAALDQARETVASTMTRSTTESLQDAHNPMIKSHVLMDLELIYKIEMKIEAERRGFMWLLDSRLDIIGADHDDKQYVLGIRRAAMELMK